jgi:membrane-associated phospholipid phosphatase
MSSRRGGRRVALAGRFLAFLALASAASPARATDEVPAGPAPPASREEAAAVHPDDGRRTMSRWPANLGRDFVGVFHKDNLVPFLVGGAATGAAAFLDDDVRESTPGEIGLLNWGSDFETGAGAVWSSVFVAGMFTAGRFAHGSRFRAMTYDMLDAAIVNFSYTEVLKVTVRRERPDGSDNKSFPSGHTSNAFALAAVAERHYGWKVGVPGYLLAGLVGASRVEQDRHWLSDVVAGATLGYIVGRTVVRVNSRPIKEGSPRKAAFSVAPIVARRTQGVMLSVVF